jgi:hypothetical protein
MEILSKKEKFDSFKVFISNPYARIEMFFKEKKFKRQEKELQLKLAVLSGGIKKMK